MALFDIDGTLTQTSRVDDQCFVQSFADELGVTGIDTNWANYPTVCDWGLTREIFQRYLQRQPSADELMRLQRRFVALLEQAYEQDPLQFAAIPGAGGALRELRQRHDWAVAIATGGWELSARFKLEKAQIDIEGIPAAFADHGITREVILATAIVLARRMYQQEQFSHIVYIGDGVWDVRTARQLNLAFLGVASGEREAALRAAGATAIIQNFADIAQFRQVIEELVYGKSVVCASAESSGRPR
ncbi:MAG: HAD family hydrolase [Candidatus Binatia bacterium]